MKKIFYLGICIVLLISGCITGEKLKSNELVFKGSLLHFRADLREAQKIEVLPDEDTLANMLLNEDLERVIIALPNISQGAGYYGVAAYELAYKLTFIYNSIYSAFRNPVVYEEDNFTCIYYRDFQKTICMGRSIFSNYESLRGDNKTVIIALLGENFTEKTNIVAKPAERVILVKGKSFSMEKGYTELDLATDKLLLVLFQHLAK